MFEQKWHRLCVNFTKAQQTWLKLAMQVNFPPKYEGPAAFWEAARQCDTLVVLLGDLENDLDAFRAECAHVAELVDVEPPRSVRNE